ncbi:prophage tail fiber N-terminal domain-containing protein [Serratia marcescens]
MALISDILRGPYGDPQPNVIITMRAKETSARVLVSNSSAAITAADGKYSMQVFPGEYEVMVSTLGKVGEIRVYPDSKDGTLNDFLITPGEEEVTPEIVQTVETLRAEAAISADKSAASAAAAKISENNAAGTLANAIKNGGYGQIIPPRISGPIGARRYCKIAESPISATGATGVHFAIVGGRNYGSPGMDLKYVYFSGRGSTITALHARGLEILSLGVTPSGGDIELGTLYNKTIDRWELWVSGPAFNVPSITLLGCIRESPMLDVVPMSDYKWQAAPDGYKAYPIKNTYSDYNVTVDGNGFLKAASPVVKLFRDGTSELNNESQGVTTERVSEGVYRISGTLGFNADAQWGGTDGGIEVPLDRNKQPLIWVDYEVEPTGDLLIKTYHRTHPAAPEFARNDILGYDEGMPIDIPEGRWVDLRVEMPAVDEPGTEEETTA